MTAMDVRSPGVHNIFGTNPSSSPLNWYSPNGVLPDGSGKKASEPPGTTAVGHPFAGLRPWLVGFAVLAVVITLAADSPEWQAAGYALLMLIVVSYVFASWSQLVSEFDQLFGVSY